MSIDLIIYAVVALGLVIWLRSVLGTRHGEERTRSAPLVTKDEDASKAKTGFGRSDPIKSDAHDAIHALVKNPSGIMSVRAEAENGLLDIASADREFDAKDFLNKVQDAFAIIVESFAEGDTDTLVGLLHDPVYNAFNDAIIARDAKEHTQSTQIHAIEKAEIIAAHLDKQTAYITVSFVAKETTLVMDVDGDVVSGHASAQNELRDIWVFSRALKSRDPRWWLHETKGDFEGDNDMIPDTDAS